MKNQLAATNLTTFPLNNQSKSMLREIFSTAKYSLFPLFHTNCMNLLLTFWRKKDMKYGNYNQKVIQDLRINNHETPFNNQYDCMHTCWMLVFMI